MTSFSRALGLIMMAGSIGMVYGQQNGIKIPPKAIVRAFVTDYNDMGSQPIGTQGTPIMVTYAWDLNRTCFSEIWESNTFNDYGKATCSNQTVVNKNKACTTSKE